MESSGALASFNARTGFTRVRWLTEGPAHLPALTGIGSYPQIGLKPIAESVLDTTRI